MELLILLAIAFTVGYAFRRAPEPRPPQVIYVQSDAPCRGGRGKIIAALIVLGLIALFASL